MSQNKEPADELMNQKIALDKEAVQLRESESSALKELQVKVGTIGNLVHESVPTSNTEDDNLQLKTWHPDGPNAQVEKKNDILSHHEVMHRLDILDMDRGEPFI